MIAKISILCWWLYAQTWQWYPRYTFSIPPNFGATFLFIHLPSALIYLPSDFRCHSPWHLLFEAENSTKRWVVAKWSPAVLADIPHWIDCYAHRFQFSHRVNRIHVEYLVKYLLPLHPIIEIVPFSWNNSCRWMQFGLSFVALLEIYAVGGEKSGTWISIGYVVGQIKLPPSFSDLWSQDEVSEDIA